MTNFILKIEKYKGINELNLNLDFNTRNSYHIYSPNGTGKTTILEAIEDKIQDKECSEHILIKEAVTLVNIEHDFDNILTFKSFENIDIDFKNHIFLKDKNKELDFIKLKNDILEELKTNEDLKLLKKYTKNKSLESVIEDYKILKNSNLFKIEENKEYFLSKHNNAVKTFLDIIKKEDDFIKLKKYIKEYSTLTKKNKSITSLKNILISLKEFLNMGFKIKEEEVKSFENDVFTIDEKLKNIEKINEKLIFLIEKDFCFSKKITESFDCYEDFQKHLKSILFYKNKDVLEKWIDTIKKYNDFLEEINENRTVWKKTRSIFEKIFFNFPIKLKEIIGSDHYSISNKKYTKIDLEFKDPFDKNNNIVLNLKQKQYFKKELSNFEKKGVYIFDIIYKIESALLQNNNILIIFDDIIEAFDGVNGGAFIEYLKDLEYSNISFVMLSHNYDLFRKTGCKFENNQNIIMTKDSENKVFFENFIDPVGNFKKVFFNTNKIKLNPHYLISNICILREIGNETKDEIEDDSIHDFFHWKKRTKSLNINSLIDINKKEILGLDMCKNDYSKCLDLTYFEILDYFCDHIDYNSVNNNPFENISYKILLSLYIRIHIEIFCKQKIDPDFKEEKYLTKQIIKDCENQMKIDLSDFKKYDIATANIIHLNSLNYEALFYYDLEKLLNIYNNLKKNYKIYNFTL